MKLNEQPTETKQPTTSINKRKLAAMIGLVFIAAIFVFIMADYIAYKQGKGINDNIDEVKQELDELESQNYEDELQDIRDVLQGIENGEKDVDELYELLDRLEDSLSDDNEDLLHVLEAIEQDIEDMELSPIIYVNPAY